MSKELFEVENGLVFKVFVERNGSYSRTFFKNEYELVFDVDVTEITNGINVSGIAYLEDYMGNILPITQDFEVIIQGSKTTLSPLNEVLEINLDLMDYTLQSEEFPSIGFTNPTIKSISVLDIRRELV
jgi:hypothetical protein